MQQSPLDLLIKFFGYRSFRPGQREIIDAVISGRDVVVLMPTGGGKSVCYQIPALHMEGCAIVVSPLIALMEDQATALIANGVPAAAIHSGRSDADNLRAIEAAIAGRIKLIYISPERLVADIDTWLTRVKINLFAIDEAHCISQWGHDFRPVYTQLSFIKQKYPSTPIMALTATADKLTRDDIIRQLNLQSPLRWIGSFDRPNLSLDVQPGSTKKSRVATVQRLIRQYPNDSGIVYTLSRAAAEEFNEALLRLGFRSCVYHAGLSAAERSEAQRAFTNGDVQAVCATIAFGMGIDKSNIRWVVHNNLPGNIESYYQEIGRAGRDGLPARTILFYSMQDLIMRRHFLEESGQPGIANEKLDWMQRYAESQICRRRVLLSYFGESMEHDCGNCDVCLNPPSRFDGTILVQKAASAVLRTGSQVGIFLLNDILRGSARAEIIRKGFDKIKTYGVGRDLSTNEWNAYIAQMIQLGLLEIAFDDANHLRVTDYGMRVVRGEATVELAYYVARAPKSARGKAKEQIKISTDPTEQLLEQLKAVRKSIAAADNIPAYMVFSDASLLDMAKRRPATMEEFMLVNGVGERKGVRFGKKFITAIRKFEGLTATMPQGTTYKETLILHNAGVPLGEMAQIKGISTETVLGHIARLIDEDMITNFASYIARKDYETIIGAFKAQGDAAWEKLKEDYSTGLLRVARSIYHYHQRKENG